MSPDANCVLPELLSSVILLPIRSVGLWLWYINITIAFLSFIYNTAYRRLDFFSVFKWNLLRCTQQKDVACLRNVVLYVKDRTIDNVQICDSYMLSVPCNAVTTHAGNSVLTCIVIAFLTTCAGHSPSDLKCVLF
jgi:hypothetical protein